ncbi:MAG: sarcosine oxidase subunit alpha family protein [Mesorhizobium sp.]|uniref:sarcosine oxidase subunit alpha family protein n=1 Tax=Mesorhizobium sp. TaxID=1871066 RepID=UPI000FE9C09C|nr:sarcosine oxidase subunit alpha family protein [Mesorhizobium sp.]RWA88212.1 MAG: sarcosine oxidase subunit alpha family protein [Mesorhizobium sp.]RWB58662.1 MAG: sarcosine oxidase subunit alpha family protein [Mesorhizobium sp.]TIU35788.1 MAG: sarcosine oxidase subunit alpha family protein [Mesorhizobium sp.]
MTARRLPSGGRIDRSRKVRVQFDGRPLPAYAGDTLASALLASGQKILGRSFKYHRPRGLVAAGVEETNVLVHLRDRDRHEPNTQATMVEVFEGLTSTSQNAWPSLRFDLGAVNGLMSRFFGAGFYYKTFIGPFSGTKFWMFCEGFIRKAAGMGRAKVLADPDHYEKINAFCDVLVVGAGPAGIAAALAAGRKGDSVILVEQDCAIGGSLLSEPADSPPDAWLAKAEFEFKDLPNVRVLTRTTAFGAYDCDVFGLVERVQDHLLAPEQGRPRQRYWVVRTKRAVLATGAIERPMVFAGNDVPGVMLTSAVRSYLNRYAVLAGERIVVATNNDSAYTAAIELANSGAIVTICDMRNEIPAQLGQEAKRAGIVVWPGHAVLKAEGGKRVKAAQVVPVRRDGKAIGRGVRVDCDIVTVSGGWTPTLHLWTQRFGNPQYDKDLDAFVPTPEKGAFTCVGSLIGSPSLREALAQGDRAGGGTGEEPGLFGRSDFWGRNLLPVAIITKADGSIPGKAFVDFQHDVKLADIDQAHLEGYVSVEHLKRYTTSGMAADQGKTSNLNALARMAELRGLTMSSVGTTTFRPPYTPVTIGAIVGHDHGLNFRPTRLSTIHGWHEENGAEMIDAGAWLRPWYYPTKGEDINDAYVREAAHVRRHVGIVDVSTLGKIIVQGPDAAEFLNRVYVNGFKTLPIGRLRYGVMLREDGFVFDDGATARLGECEYFMTTTTANAAKVLANAEYLLQTTWRDLRVHVTSVTDQWAAIAIAGPKSRSVLSDLTGTDLGNDTLPNNHFTHVKIAGVACRLHRMSYSGELAYELYAPAKRGRTIWETLIAVDASYQLKPYGVEAMGALRIEKGHIAGSEIDGRTTLKDLGLEGFASGKKPFVGSVLRKRPVLLDAMRPSLVGLEIAGDIGARAGSLLYGLNAPTKGHGEGWVSAVTYSPSLKKNIALALLSRGPQRFGETIQVIDFVGNQRLEAKVVSHHFFDPEGRRQNG